EGGKNESEEELLARQLARNNLNIRFYYDKIKQNKDGKKLVDNLKNILEYPLSVIVFNFVDMLSHARTEMQMIRELAGDESAYRSLTLSWFKHSPLHDLFKELAGKKVRLVLTTDHGMVRVNNPIKVIGDRNTTTNLRYKQGRNLNYNPKEVFEITDPQKVHLPKTNISSTYIFATNDDFFAYPNNYNHYVKYYKDTFQHGGVSLEEMLVPVITLTPK
ncbi:MAG: PglZ domain-containing protein, partial [Bacteroidetes bacterium]|nr:PglZ domain-containing protein [Bacteroidota bacterium]